MEAALQNAIESLGATALARELGVTVQAIYQWKVCPAKRVLDVERLTGVSRHALRPDIFGPARPERASA